MNWNPPMTLEELKQRTEEANWFTNLGTYPGSENTTVIKSLDAPDVPDAWDWLPTTNEEPDPIHVPSLATIAKQQSVYSDYSKIVLENNKITLVSLRKMDENNPLLRIGAINGVNAARGVALYAIRMAFGEIILKKQGFWCSLLPYYFNGYWPCGLTDDNKLVIF